MKFSQQLDQFVEREAVKYYYVETATQEEKAMYRQISIIDYKAGQASLKPIVLKLVEALQFYKEPNNIADMALAEIERMIGGEK